MKSHFSNTGIQPVLMCSFCKEKTSQTWEELANILSQKVSTELSYVPLKNGTPTTRQDIRDMFKDPEKIASVFLCECNKCFEKSLWIRSEDDTEMQVFPPIFDYPEPHTEMPKEVQTIYVQAGKILKISPSASTALSRLALEKLLTLEGLTQNNLNDKIGAVIDSKKLNSGTEKLLDIIRHYGNKGIHTGTIDLNDEDGISQFVLESINNVVDDLIAKPNKTDEMFNNLPESFRKSIEKRDSQK